MEEDLLASGFEDPEQLPAPVLSQSGMFPRGFTPVSSGTPAGIADAYPQQAMPGMQQSSRSPAMRNLAILAKAGNRKAQEMLIGTFGQQAQLEARAQVQMQLQQTQLTAKEEQRLQRMKNAIADVAADPNLDERAKADLITQLKTGINPMERRKAMAAMQSMEQQDKMRQQQMAKMQAEMHQNEAFQAKSFQEKVATYVDPETGRPTRFYQQGQGKWVPLQEPKAEKEQQPLKPQEVTSRAVAMAKAEFGGIVPSKDDVQGQEKFRRAVQANVAKIMQEENVRQGKPALGDQEATDPWVRMMQGASGGGQQPQAGGIQPLAAQAPPVPPVASGIASVAQAEADKPEVAQQLNSIAQRVAAQPLDAMSDAALLQLAQDISGHAARGSEMRAVAGMVIQELEKRKASRGGSQAGNASLRVK